MSTLEAEDSRNLINCKISLKKLSSSSSSITQKPHLHACVWVESGKGMPSIFNYK